MENMTSEKKSKKRKTNEFEEEVVFKQKPKKKKKKKEEPEVVKEDEIGEIDEGERNAIMYEEENDTLSPNENDAEESESWTKEDSLELIRRMEEQLPKNDKLSFNTRAEKLDWEKITFGNHSVKTCFEHWKMIKGKVRHYRLLSEVLQDAKDWVQQPWLALKKKSRHPDQPARPLSSFMLFYMDKKNKIIKRHPELKLTEISRLIGEKYKALSDEKKNYYIEKARQMQEEYKQNLSKFYEKHPELVKAVKKPTTLVSYKPLPPMKIYLREKLLKHQNDENFNKQEYIEKYKETWKNLSKKKKAYWIRLAKEEEDKYLEDLYGDELQESKIKHIYKSVISKEEQSILDRLAGKPEKPPNSAYSLFSRLMLKDKDKNFVDGEPKNRMREIANKWKEVPDEQKRAYAEKVQHMIENYKLEFANYLETLPEEKRAEELAKLQPKKKPTKVKQKISKKDAVRYDGSGQELFKNEPEKPPVTAWDLFKTEFVKKHCHLPTKVAFKEAANVWKTLSRKEVEKYKKKHEHLKDKYLTDFEAFLKTLTEEELKEYSAVKNARFGADELNDESLEEESSNEEEEENSSDSGSSSSEDGDSGVSG